MAAIGLVGVAERAEAAGPDGRRSVERTAVAVTLPVVVALGDVRLPPDALARAGRGEPSAATLGLDAPASPGPSGHRDGGWHWCPRAAGAHLAAAGAEIWRGRAPPHAGSDVVHA